MKSTAHLFKAQAHDALQDAELQQALRRVKGGFIGKRQAALEQFPDFEGLREHGKRIKEHTLANLDVYLEQFERRVESAGGHVHWAPTGKDAVETILQICRTSRARRVTKAKTMAGEEIGVNEALEEANFEVVETDLGEYIIQLAKEPPSHIIAPAIHKTRRQISELFDTYHHRGQLKEKLREVPELVNEARRVLRDKFLTADVGITGANFLVAETGSVILVTNEGNADLTHTLPRVHLVIAGIEKVVPNLKDASTLIRLLGRSATGQEMTAYTSLVTGPRREDDPDGPEEFHVVLVDNGRSRMLADEFHEMLRCIRCGACLNHCPVYSSVGGHAYGWVYPGPMGSVLTPMFLGLDKARDLPNACTLNGRCKSVCPVKIPLPDLLRKLRERQFQTRVMGLGTRSGLSVWGFFARRPKLYHRWARYAVKALRRMARGQGSLKKVPLAGGWTDARDLPVPEGETFQAAWQRRKQERGQ